MLQAGVLPYVIQHYSYPDLIFPPLLGAIACRDFYLVVCRVTSRILGVEIQIGFASTLQYHFCHKSRSNTTALAWHPYFASHPAVLSNNKPEVPGKMCPGTAEDLADRSRRPVCDLFSPFFFLKVAILILWLKRGTTPFKLEAGIFPLIKAFWSLCNKFQLPKSCASTLWNTCFPMPNVWAYASACQLPFFVFVFQQHFSNEMTRIFFKKISLDSYLYFYARILMLNFN